MNQPRDAVDVASLLLVQLSLILWLLLLLLLLLMLLLILLLLLGMWKRLTASNLEDGISTSI